jgi:hypothetical protein
MAWTLYFSSSIKMTGDDTSIATSGKVIFAEADYFFQRPA